MYLEDLKGIERQKQKVIQNTLQFLKGLPANDVLLTGARGTGKSSIVRALLTEYADQGLRLIEIERDDLSDLPEIEKLIKGRPEKFIVYCDDLAFNAEDENYRSLKSVLDGSLQSGNNNFIIYATSNRRHLLPEFMHENTPVTKVDVPQYTELHPQEAIEEKISLSDRFGLWLSFYPMDQALYLEVVEHYLKKPILNLQRKRVPKPCAGHKVVGNVLVVLRISFLNTGLVQIYSTNDLICYMIGLAIPSQFLRIWMFCYAD
jgi:predicted AAA+ superfamily ATPase